MLDFPPFIFFLLVFAVEDIGDCLNATKGFFVDNTILFVDLFMTEYVVDFDVTILVTLVFVVTFCRCRFLVTGLNRNPGCGNLKFLS